MLNKCMEEKLQAGDALDVSPYRQNAGQAQYVLPDDWAHKIIDRDLCDAKTEEWIWSVGKHRATGEIHASTSSILYENPQYHCIWLR